VRFASLKEGRTLKINWFLRILKLPHSVQFLCQSTPFIAPTKYTALINTNVKGASPECFGTSAPASGRTKCESLESSGHWKAVTCKVLRSVAASLLTYSIKDTSVQIFKNLWLEYLKNISYLIQILYFIDTHIVEIINVVFSRGSL